MTRGSSLKIFHVTEKQRSFWALIWLVVSRSPTLEDFFNNNNIKFFSGAFKKLNALTLLYIYIYIYIYIKSKLLKTYKMFHITVINKIIENN